MRAGMTVNSSIQKQSSPFDPGSLAKEHHAFIYARKQQKWRQPLAVIHVTAGTTCAWLSCMGLQSIIAGPTNMSIWQLLSVVLLNQHLASVSGLEVQ